MTEYTQLEMLSEGFWGGVGRGLKNTAKGVGGVFGTAIRGGAKALDYLAPELTNPLHKLEHGIRDIGQSVRMGWDWGSGGKTKTIQDRLLDGGYVMDKNEGVTKSGKNAVVIAHKITGYDQKTGKPKVGKVPVSILVDRNYNFKIIGQSSHNTLSMAGNKPTRTP